VYVLLPDTLIGLGVQPAIVDHVDHVEHVVADLLIELFSLCLNCTLRTWSSISACAWACSWTRSRTPGTRSPVSKEWGFLLVGGLFI